MNDHAHGAYGASMGNSNFDQTTYRPVKAESKRWQFSLKSMLFGMTLVAVIVGMIAVPPFAAFVLCAIGLCAAISLVVAIIYGRGWIRPFAIVAAVPMTILPFALAGMRGGPEEFFILTIVFYGVAIFSGFSGAVAHGYLKRRSGKVPVPNIPFIRNMLSND